MYISFQWFLYFIAFIFFISFIYFSSSIYLFSCSYFAQNNFPNVNMILFINKRNVNYKNILTKIYSNDKKATK